MTNEKDYSENLSKTLNVLADKLGVKAEELFSTVIKQSKIELIMNIICLVLFVAMVITGIWLAFYIYPFWLADEKFPVSKQVCVMLATVATPFLIIIPLVAIFPTIHDLVTLKLNPKYWALKDIMRSVK